MKLLREEDFPKVVVAAWNFNARQPATITGDAVAWKYADGHGCRLVAILRRGKEAELWIPGHHGHGPGTRTKLTISADGQITETELPSARIVEI